MQVTRKKLILYNTVELFHNGRSVTFDLYFFLTLDGIQGLGCSEVKWGLPISLAYHPFFIILVDKGVLLRK